MRLRHRINKLDSYTNLQLRNSILFSSLRIASRSSSTRRLKTSVTLSAEITELQRSELAKEPGEGKERQILHMLSLIQSLMKSSSFLCGGSDQLSDSTVSSADCLVSQIML